MAQLAAQLLKPPSLPSLLAGLTRRWSLGRYTPDGGPTEPPKDPLLITGQQLREAREAQGLGLRELAQQTRISTAVLEALEEYADQKGLTVNAEKSEMFNSRSPIRYPET